MNDVTNPTPSSAQKVKKKKKIISDPIQRELDNVKRLLILLLYSKGVLQSDIAKALEMDAGDLSRYMPASKFSFNGKKKL